MRTVDDQRTNSDYINLEAAGPPLLNKGKLLSQVQENRFSPHTRDHVVKQD